MADSTGRVIRRTAMVNLPFKAHSPLVLLGRRAMLAFMLMVVSTAIVYFDRGSYIDNVTHTPIGFVDALYYSTVTVTTTGYGDITPLTPSARLISAVVITPLRIGFLVLLVGATLEVLANEGRRGLRDASWRRHMRNHTVVIDAKSTAIAEANRHGLAAFEGDATRRDLLRRAEVAKAREVIITLPRDDTAILTTLTVRQLNARCHIVVAGREEENLSLLRESGANAVVTSADAVGRLLGLTTVNPHVGEVVDDLISSAHGMEVIERMVSANEVGARPADIVNERVLAVVRNGTLRNFYDPMLDKLETGDSVIVVRRALTRRRGAPQPPHS